MLMRCSAVKRRPHFGVPCRRQTGCGWNRRPAMKDLFSHHSEGCTLRTMLNRPAKWPPNWIIAALLVFQLAFGLQWEAARAVVTPPEGQMDGMQAGRCPAHSSNDSRTDPGGGAGVSTSAQFSHHSPANKYDCCRSLGCQCHCAQSPGALGLPLSGVAPSPALQLPVFDARPPISCPSEFFRPPIA
jgi:hypothetical protein